MTNDKFKEMYPELVDKMVLSVDDDEMNQLVLAKILNNIGVKTIAARNGAEAIKQLKDGLKPDFILMDLEMPVMNGLQTSEYIKKNIDAQLPVIINSGAVSDLQKWRLRRLGITSFLEKPYSMNDIFSKMSHFLSIVHH